MNAARKDVVVHMVAAWVVMVIALALVMTALDAPPGDLTREEWECILHAPDASVC